MSALARIDAALRFLTELAALAILAAWGWRAGEGATAYALAVGAPLVAALAWGIFVAPKSRWRLSDPLRLLVEWAVFLAAGLALGWLTVPLAGGAFVGISIGLALLMRRRENEETS